MNQMRWFLHALFLLLLPLIVAGFGLSLATAVALVLLVLLWRWMITLSLIMHPAQGPELVLQSISVSHFVEKTRWCMDRLGLNYTEKPSAGTLGAFFAGRTVPVLRIRTGLVYSVIGNSPEILRYLWGRYAAEAGQAATFLEPTRERLELERRIDRCGVDLQVWVYASMLSDRELTLHAWGSDDPAVPRYQRLLLRPLFPVLRMLIRKSFRLSESRYLKAVGNIDRLLGEVEASLADGRKSLLGGSVINFTDISFAAISGLWLQPPAYGGGKAAAVRIDRARAPEKMRADIERWICLFPRACAFVEDLYRQQRQISSG